MIKKRNRLTTLIGGLIDKMSYSTIATYICVILFICSTYFWLLNPHGHGTDQKELNWFNALYFCIITFSSLGYGDILPVGFGKVITSFQVLSGLALTAIFIGKIASERQSAMLLLVYTSINQRRLVEFEQEIDDLTDQIESALAEHNHDKLHTLSLQVYSFVASINNYLKFQSNQGGLASFGNTSSLRRLYQSIFQLQNKTYEAIRTFGVQQKTKSKLGQVVIRINNLATAMMVFHTTDAKINPLLKEIQKTKDTLENWNNRLGDSNPDYIFRNEVSNFLLDKVLQRLPQHPWPRHIHKKIASELCIQNKLAQKCIDKLILDKRTS